MCFSYDSASIGRYHAVASIVVLSKYSMGPGVHLDITCPAQLLGLLSSINLLQVNSVVSKVPHRSRTFSVAELLSGVTQCACKAVGSCCVKCYILSGFSGPHDQP